MFQKIKKTATVAAAILSLSTQVEAFGELTSPGSSSLKDDGAQTVSFRIKVENLTQSQSLTPPLIVIGDDLVFKVGEPSSRAMSFLAEDGDLSDFQKSKGFENALFTNKGISPGSVQIYQLDAKLSDLTSRLNQHYTLSFASMLASTNDAFVGLDRVRLSGGFGSPFAVGRSSTFNLKVYDAGTERNTERCEHIPGPPCGSHNVRSVRGAEGVVTLHPGLGLLNSDLSHLDLFPTVGARVTVTRTK